MAVSMQVAYPINDDTNFDLDYYIKDHLAIIKKNWSEHIQQMIVTKGTSGGKDVPSPYYAIATVIFENAEEKRSFRKMYIFVCKMRFFATENCPKKMLV